MGYYKIQETTLTNIADNVRRLTGSSGPVDFSNIGSVMGNIEAGGGSGGNNKDFVDLIEGDLTEISNSEVTKIGTAAFYQCSTLKTADFPACKSIGNSAFYSCYSLTSVDFPECTNIGNDAFYKCSNLTSINFPACTSISASAFMGCYGLTSISFLECTSIAYSAFMGCSGLTKADFPKCTNINGYAFQNCYSLSSVNFPKCTSIGAGVFTNCSKLASVDFPTCKNIGLSAFIRCSSLILANFPECTTIYSYAFFNCSNLTSINFPACTSISASAFNGCTSLTSVNFPTCTSIGSGVFGNCTSLTSVNFPACTFIGTGAFGNCTSLTSVRFPACTSISASAFNGCTSLTSVNFPACTSINYNVFSGCTSLSNLYLGASIVCNLGNSNAFYGTLITSTTGSIYVTLSLVDSYKAATNWTYFSKIIKPMADIAVDSISDKRVLLNTTTNIVTDLILMDGITLQDITITSTDETIANVSNIQTTSDTVAFDVITYDKEGEATITLTLVSNTETITETFNVSVWEVIPTPEYSIDTLGSQYTFALNSNDYYESNNKGQDSSYAMCRVNINAPIDCKMHVDCINYAESNYDYGLLSNLDTTLNSSATADTTNVYKSFKGSQSANIQTVSYDIPAGEHYIYIKYIKDNSQASGNDSLQFKIRFD